MAEIRKIVRSSPISGFQQVAPEAGGGFRALALAAQAVYDRAAPAAKKFMEDKGAEEARAYARQQFGDPLAGATDTLGLLRQFEGFRDTPYWDVNAFRVGYGSDTITLADGTVKKVAAGDKITREDAERDLNRRVTQEFEPIVAKAIGADAFATLSPAQRAAATSIAYNYGEIPDRIAGALRSGDSEAAAAAIRGLAGDNGGINAKRRNREADIFATGSQSTIVRTSEGKLEPRLYSPMSGEILAAHDAAFGVALNSEIMLRGVSDMMNMSEQFALDPDGFRQAATSYVDQMVKGAPEQFRSDIRASLEKEVTRRFLGVMEDKQADIRKRADNSSAALVDRWSSNLAEAMASGNKDEIDSARTELDSLLFARENLPGVAWTPEQSANVIAGAHKEADRIRKEAAKEAADRSKASLRTIRDAAKSGMHAADEGKLYDPALQAADPELWLDAVGATLIRDWLPSFKSAPPSEQAATVAQMKADPVTNDIQIATVKAAEDAAKESAKAWEDDPIKQAEAVLDVKPPPLPTFDTVSPEAFVDALKARAEYGRRLAKDGYIAAPAFLSDAEAETVGALLSKDVDPAIKTLVSGAIAAGFGDDAATVFREIKSDDPVTRYAGMMVAAGGDQAVATAAIRGQSLLDEGVVQAPSGKTVSSVLDGDIATALSVLPNDALKSGELLTMATAIYANNARGVDPSSADAKEKLTTSLQLALGQSTNRRGQTTGGVQKVSGQPVLLPVGVAGEDVEAALHKGLGKPQPSMMEVLTFSAPDPEAWAGNADFWSKVGSGMPMLGGRPVTEAMLRKGNVRIVPAGKLYRMETVINGAPVSDVRDGTGNLFRFDMQALLDAAR